MKPLHLVAYTSAGVGVPARFRIYVMQIGYMYTICPLITLTASETAAQCIVIGPVYGCNFSGKIECRKLSGIFPEKFRKLSVPEEV